MTSLSALAARRCSDETVLGGPDGDLSPRREAEPAEDAGDVGIDGAPAHDEALADLAVGEAARHEGCNLTFAARQRIAGICRRLLSVRGAILGCWRARQHAPGKLVRLYYGLMRCQGHPLPAIPVELGDSESRLHPREQALEPVAVDRLAQRPARQANC